MSPDQPEINEAAFVYDDRLARVRELVLRNLASAPSLAEAAEAACVERTYFSRLFRQRVGTTYSAWLRARRVRYAQQLLRSRDTSIHEVARRVGYEDARGLQRAFKKLLGMTPSEFRAQVRPF